MNLLKKLTTRVITLTIEPDKVTIKDEDSGRAITRSPSNPYSCGRVFISHFAVFEDFLKSMLEELFPKTGLVLFTKSYEMHITTKHNFNTPISEVEIRSVIDGCEHAGARYIILNGRKD